MKISVRTVCAGVLGIALAGGGILLAARRSTDMASPAGRPSVILITVDSLRPDHLGYSGNPAYRTPNIDALARQGVVFTTALSQATWTWPSVHSLFTSMYPSTNGMIFWDRVLNAKTRTLVDVFNARGYRTSFVNAHPGLAALTLRFQEVEYAGNARADEVSARAIDWCRRHAAEPFFLWVHYMDTHSQLYCGLEDEQKESLVWSPEQIREYTAAYDRGVSAVDRGVGSLVAALKSLGLDDRTIVIVTADHGEELGEHGRYFFHGRDDLYDAQIRVPLIIRAPRAFAAGRTIAVPVELIDLAPTLCELTGNKQEKAFRGTSLVALVTTGARRWRYAISEHTQTEGDFLSKNGIASTLVALRTAQWKCVETQRAEGITYRLFDITNDPQELHDLAAQHPEKIAEFTEALGRWREEGTSVFAPEYRSLTEDQKNRLKSLGYIQ